MHDSVPLWRIFKCHDTSFVCLHMWATCGFHFANDTIKSFFVLDSCCALIQIALEVVSKDPIEQNANMSTIAICVIYEGAIT